MTDARVLRTEVRELTSPANSLVKVFRRALREGVTRDGWLAIEGHFLLEEALEAFSQPPGDKTKPSGSVHTVLFSHTAADKFSILLSRLPKEAEVARVSDRLFEQLAQTETPQGVAALVELSPPELESVLACRDASLLIACGIQDPGNLGNMMRGAWALGGTALVALRETVSPLNPKAVRSSAGAIFRLPVFRNLEAGDVLARARAAGITIIAADHHSSDSIAQADLRGPVALLIGREAAGVEEKLLQEADLRLRIPIRAETDSLNAAAAAGIFLYERARQRGFRYS